MVAPTSDPPGDLAALADRYGLPRGTARSLATLLARLAGDERAPTSISGTADALDRHIADSLAALELPLVREATIAADLGSGAGIPGLVLAAALPGLRMRLVEAQQSKCAYMATLVGAMGLANARVVCSRAESWRDGREAHDLVVARALGAQPLVLEYAAPLLKLGGKLVEWRGERVPGEEARAASAAFELGLQAEEVRAVVPFAGARARHLHVFGKVAGTPARFPRREGLAARKPLGG